jgi:hypothetical protein
MRAVASDPAALQLLVPGSYTSPLASVPAPVNPPAASTFPLPSSVIV